MTADADVLGESGMRALRAERQRVTELNRRVRRTEKELRETKVLLHNLRSAVVSATNHLIDVAEQAGAQRNDNN